MKYVRVWEDVCNIESPTIKRALIKYADILQTWRYRRWNRSKYSYRNAMEYSSKNHFLLEKLNKIYKQNNLPILEPECENGGFDAAYITQCGIPCIDGFGTK